jgi:hypothetical protein
MGHEPEVDGLDDKVEERSAEEGQSEARAGVGEGALAVPLLACSPSFGGVVVW